MLLVARLAAFSWFGLCAAPLPATAAGNGSLSGRFRDGFGQPVANARLTLLGTALVATSGTNGSYSFPNLPSGDHTVQL